MPSSSASTRNKAKLGLKGGKKGRGDPSKPGPAVGGAAYRMSEWPPDTGPDGQLEARADNVSLSAALRAPLCSTEPACGRACMDCCADPAFACLYLQHLQQTACKHGPSCATEARLRCCELACCFLWGWLIAGHIRACCTCGGCLLCELARQSISPAEMCAVLCCSISHRIGPTCAAGGMPTFSRERSRSGGGSARLMRLRRMWGAPSLPFQTRPSELPAASLLLSQAFLGG